MVKCECGGELEQIDRTQFMYFVKCYRCVSIYEISLEDDLVVRKYVYIK